MGGYLNWWHLHSQKDEREAWGTPCRPLSYLWGSFGMFLQQQTPNKHQNQREGAREQNKNPHEPSVHAGLRGAGGRI